MWLQIRSYLNLIAKAESFLHFVQSLVLKHFYSDQNLIQTLYINGCLLNTANSDVINVESTNEDVSISEATSTVGLVIKTAR